MDARKVRAVTVHRRCCDDPDNLRELDEPDDHVLVCIQCGTVLAHADERDELFADL